MLKLIAGWSGWHPLTDRAARLGTPRGPGLYRVRAVGDTGLAYVGQTKSLSRRLNHLTVLYQDEIPYNDPHTAAPCLWVMRTVHGAEFEFSVVEVAGDVRDRMAAESVVVSEHRAEFGRSPTASFGRMPDGWVKSSGNNKRLAQAGRLVRGYPDSRKRRSGDHPSVLDSGRDPTAPDWAAMPWSRWSSNLITRPIAGQILGVYRVRRSGDHTLLYIGQGRVNARLTAHVLKGRRASRDHHAAFAGDLEASWVALPGCTPAQRMEVECDLIASHILRTKHAPELQFLG
ncbi:GIY-YIG nuclease family protein [Virgisporangium ochraceum]|uniref:GIY-YIG nuclease family protein n=1 Tax=Virgisporangium ochraceum TaxID=65505 RepID=UPI0019406F7C|nr:GIY-YIG nuclease family protein [Virgisporangium ochraceum]